MLFWSSYELVQIITFSPKFDCVLAVICAVSPKYLVDVFFFLPMRAVWKIGPRKLRVYDQGRCVCFFIPEERTREEKIVIKLSEC